MHYEGSPDLPYFYFYAPVPILERQRVDVVDPPLNGRLAVGVQNERRARVAELEESLVGSICLGKTS